MADCGVCVCIFFIISRVSPSVRLSDRPPHVRRRRRNIIVVIIIIITRERSFLVRFFPFPEGRERARPNSLYIKYDGNGRARPSLWPAYEKPVDII